jgi:hypothetical protein
MGGGAARSAVVEGRGDASGREITRSASGQEEPWSKSHADNTFAKQACYRPSYHKRMPGSRTMTCLLVTCRATSGECGDTVAPGEQRREGGLRDKMIAQLTAAPPVL